MYLHGSSIAGSATHSIAPKSIIRMKPASNYIQHYGVPGQKWGVITKEYEPVAVDRRKLRSTHTASTNTFNKSFRPPDSKNQKLMPQKPNAGWSSKKMGDKMKKLRIATYATTAILGLLAAYGAYKYVKVTKAKAYSGLLQRFLSQNPGANMTTASGKANLLRGVQLAKANSKTLSAAKSTNSYLKRNGLNLGSKEAQRIFKSKRLIERVSKIKPGKTRLGRTINSYRTTRLRNKIFNKIFF